MLSFRPVRVAAQYLRVSSDDQLNSFAGQAATVAAYARREGFEIIASYEDCGRSGVTFEGREGLAHLIADVVAGECAFDTVLVLDVSRWGRFQDPDEAAHYEFPCRSAGVAVRYCTEQFDEGPASSLLKHFKRVMAGEYSRDLSVKVRRAKRRNALLGRAPGGVCPYGLQRQEVLPGGALGDILLRGRRKGRPEFSVQFIPGSREEQEVCRKVFRWFVVHRVGPAAIAARLNQAGSFWHDGSAWTGQRIERILACDLLAGRVMAGKCVHRMGQRRVARPRVEWCHSATIQPVISPALFKQARIRSDELNGSRGRTKAEMLDDLRRIRRTHGRLSTILIDDDPNALASATYYSAFGSLTAAYRLIGYTACVARRGRGNDGALLDQEAIIAGLRRLESLSGRVTVQQILADEALPSPHMLRKIFGSMPAAYAAAGVAWGHPNALRTP